MMLQNIAKHRCPGRGLRRASINRRIGVDADFEGQFDFRLEFDDLVIEIAPVKPGRNPDMGGRNELCE
jgi:hypothetical protein